ncbi:hypothetical protein LXL04_033571 [Taraxacum kok-saghyz]
MDDYDLHKNSWFTDMYHARSTWIPAYFKDYHYSGLMQTTSRSEVEDVGDTTKFSIKDTDPDLKRAGEYEVMFVKSNTTISCSCSKFETTGKLCRHCFYVLRMLGVEHFPAKYVSARWQKEVVPRSCSDISKSKAPDDIQKIVRDIHASVDHCVDRLSSSLEKLRVYREKQNDVKTYVDEDTIGEDPMTNKEFIETVIGVGKQSDIKVTNS